MASKPSSCAFSPDITLRITIGILVALRRAGSPFRMKPSQLVRELLLTSGGTAKALRELAARGLVERSPDAGDGRVSWVSLTAAGADLSERAIRATSKAQQELFARVPPDQVRAAAEALRKLAESQAPAGGQTPHRGA